MADLEDLRRRIVPACATVVLQEMNTLKFNSGHPLSFAANCIFIRQLFGELLKFLIGSFCTWRSVAYCDEIPFYSVYTVPSDCPWVTSYNGIVQSKWNVQGIVAVFWQCGLEENLSSRNTISIFDVENFVLSRIWSVTLRLSKTYTGYNQRQRFWPLEFC